MAVEPNIETLPAKLAEKGIELAVLNVALEKADVVVILVNHKEFQDLKMINNISTLINITCISSKVAL